MQSANKMMIPKLKLTCLLLAALPLFCFSQENSPYSRYGVGNLVPAGNIFNRGMGGIAAGYADPVTINNINPASYGSIIYTTLDVGVEYSSRTIKSQNPLGAYKSNNGIISYLQLGLPLLNGNAKADKNRTSLGMTFGLKPISKINYKINATTHNGIDSIATLYEGNGGVNEAFIGMGLKLKNFSIGFNTGYLFGEKDYNSKIIFIDTVQYYKAEYDTKTRFGGVLFNAGMQYVAKLKKGVLRLGAYGTLQREYSATKDYAVQTFQFDATSGAIDKIDSIYEQKAVKGKVTLPSTLGAGFTIEKEHVLLGADFETTNWDGYRFFGDKDQVANSWMGKFGIQYYPVPTGSSRYFNNVRYRAGVSFGKDYITAGGNDLPLYAVTIGGTFPLKVRHTFYDYQYSFLNLSLEYGNRGNSSNNIKENTFKVGVGFTLSDRNWFVRRKFN
ncbi:MAG: hypothetical protein ABIR19_11640 [Ginsengibacter sp.]